MNQSIKRLLKNYSNARKSWEAWCFMTNFNCKERNLELVNYIDSNELLFHLRYLALKDFYIEIYKVLKENKFDSDSVFKHLKELQVNDPSKKEEVIFNLNELESCRFTITELCNVRDKFYAHLDKNYVEYLKTNLNNNDIINCFIAIEKSIITICTLEIFQTYLIKIPSRNDFNLKI